MRLGKILAVAGAALLLAGCTSGNGSRGDTGSSTYHFKVSESKRGLPAQLKDDSFNASPSIYWSDKAKKTATLVAYGSGSCPVVPTDLVLNGAVKFRLPLKKYDGACTADLGAHVSVFNVPKKVSRTKAVTVTLDTAEKGASDTQLTLAPTSILTEVGK